MWITCELLWCFYQLFGLSFWRHPFTAEHPLVSKWWNDTFLQIWWRNKLICILDRLRLSTFSANFNFWGTIPLIRIRMSFIGQVCLHIRGICYSDRDHINIFKCQMTGIINQIITLIILINHFSSASISKQTSKRNWLVLEGVTFLYIYL